MASATEDLLLQQVGIDQKYDIIRKIGEGGFGQVHLVQSKDDQKQVDAQSKDLFNYLI